MKKELIRCVTAIICAAIIGFAIAFSTRYKAYDNGQYVLDTWTMQWKMFNGID